MNASQMTLIQNLLGRDARWRLVTLGDAWWRLVTSPESGDSFHHLLTPTINYSHNLWPSQPSSRGPWNYETGQAGWWRIVLAISSLEPRPRPSGIQLKCDGKKFYSKSTRSATTARAGLEGCGWKTMYEKEQRRSFPFICYLIPHFQGGIKSN